MARSKANLPSKICPSCHRPFSWRKKWERDWDRVVYCSDTCRRRARTSEPDGKEPTR
ncbi:DUF2256 domain-containing protein [Tundrisphaera lichenicola]|uniref:DUF2256 domain-containing protein n=1 Tax=Tundrisphaera lichenicola TaxID=2029860 RepID=UPI003EC0813D